MQGYPHIHPSNNRTTRSTSLIAVSLIAFILLPAIAFGQISGSVGSFGGGKVSANPWDFQSSGDKRSPHIASKHAPLNADISYTHFNPTLPTIRVAVPFVVSPYLIGAIGERFTVAGGSQAFLDSVQISIDTAIGDGFRVVAYPDTLYSTAAGDFHLMNIWSDVGQIGEVSVAFPPGGITSRTVLTAHFDQLTVPKDFWILITPNIDQSGSFTSSFGVVGDRGQMVPRSTDRVYSGYLALQQNTGLLFSGVFDSTFYDVADQPIYTNFDITAYAETAPAAVAQNSEPTELSIYPNPANEFLRVSKMVKAYSVYDGLGRQVLSGLNTDEIDTRSLPAGCYAVTTSSQGEQGRLSFVVAR